MSATFADFRIDLGGQSGVEVAACCPQCAPSRKKKQLKCMSVNTEKGVWICHHCDWRGSLKQGEEGKGRRLWTKPTPPIGKVPTDAFVQEVAARRLSLALMGHEEVQLVTAYMPQVEAHVDCIAFPYYKQSELVNIKFRSVEEKHFRQIGGAEKVFYRQDTIEKASVIICEGEWDALSCVQAGFSSVISVPDGAPPPNAKNYSAKFTYLDQDPDPFEEVQEIVLAVDNDEPGIKLRDELARRIGHDRCKMVKWPTGCKDANDVLKQCGPETLRECLTNAVHFPVQDAVEVDSLIDAVMASYLGAKRKGLTTGWPSVDQYYTIAPGQLTVITGIPSSGKSEWLDALCLNLARLHGWRIAICSPENMPLDMHMEKLLEKVAGRPFYAGPVERMNNAELVSALQWLHEHITFLAPEESLTIPAVLDRASILVRRYGIQALILDPWNEFDHSRERHITETEYISLALSTLKRWARKHIAHVFLVAHPQKLYRREDGTYPVPTPYDISGSAHFRNKADGCITVHRDFSDPASPVEVHIQKCRFKFLGRMGMVPLIWDRLTGRYYDAPEWLNQVKKP